MDKNDELDFFVMACLAGSPQGTYGYALVRALERHFGLIVPLPSVYRVLDRLITQEYIAWRQGELAERYAGMPRKICWLTDAGRREALKLAVIRRDKALRLQTASDWIERHLGGQEGASGRI